jgi:hypothetical protein
VPIIISDALNVRIITASVRVEQATRETSFVAFWHDQSGLPGLLRHSHMSIAMVVANPTLPVPPIPAGPETIYISLAGNSVRR